MLLYCKVVKEVVIQALRITFPTAPPPKGKWVSPVRPSFWEAQARDASHVIVIFSSEEKCESRSPLFPFFV